MQSRHVVVEPGELGGEGGGIGMSLPDVVLVTGWTESSGFPTTSGAWQTSLGGGRDGFAFGYVPGNTSLAFSTFAAR